MRFSLFSKARARVYMSLRIQVLLSDRSHIVYYALFAHTHTIYVFFLNIFFLPFLHFRRLPFHRHYIIMYIVINNMHKWNETNCKEQQQNMYAHHSAFSSFEFEWWTRASSDISVCMHIICFCVYQITRNEKSKFSCWPMLGFDWIFPLGFWIWVRTQFTKWNKMHKVHELHEM